MEKKNTKTGIFGAYSREREEGGWTGVWSCWLDGQMWGDGQLQWWQ